MAACGSTHPGPGAAPGSVGGSGAGGAISAGGVSGGEGSTGGSVSGSPSRAGGSSVAGSSGMNGGSGVGGSSGGADAASSGAGAAQGGAAGAGGSSGSASVAGGTASGGQTSWAVQFADTVIKRWPDPRNITGKAREWDYNNGIVLRGMTEVWNKTQDPRYLAYLKKYVDYFVDAQGALYVDAAHTGRVQDQPYSLDLILPANLLLVLSKQYPSDMRYQTAAATVRGMFAVFPVNGDGGYWHKQTYPNEMWLDGIYMAEPFLVNYGAANASCGAFCNDTPVTQATLLASHARLASGLLLHGWDFDHNAAWCTGACAGTTGTGLSPEVWGRALGWYAMSLVDILSVLPGAHPGHASLSTLLTSLAAGAKGAQDPASGLWCEVIDQCAQAGNWTESSGSGMLIYALKVGVDRGYLDPSYLSVAQKAWQGLQAQKIGSDATGPTINDAADGASIQPSYAAYVAIAKVSNSYHGLCAVQLAAAAMEY